MDHDSTGYSPAIGAEKTADRLADGWDGNDTANQVRRAVDRGHRRRRNKAPQDLPGGIAGAITGPAISISFVLAAFACGLAALCYAEFASTVPVAGSAYTFSYASFGEIVAWIIGWDLVLEFAVGAATVAKSWSNYLGEVFGFAGGEIALGPLNIDWGRCSSPRSSSGQ
jgi:hypothetical protein